jgi:biopolymer transport protein ExbB
MNHPPAYDLLSFLAERDGAGLLVLALLFSMSVASWYLIVAKTLWGAQIRHRAGAFLDRFWRAASLDAVAAELASHPPREPFGRLALQAIESGRQWRKAPEVTLARGVSEEEFLTRALRRSIQREAASLEFGLTVLASVGSTAPFIGLFGTVWGIYHALIGIGAAGTATLDAVAGPVGEALIMTAAGLAVAIPAVLAYNAFVRANRIVLAELDGFAHDLLAFVATGARPSSEVSPVSAPGPKASRGKPSAGVA